MYTNNGGPEKEILTNEKDVFLWEKLKSLSGFLGSGETGQN